MPDGEIRPGLDAEPGAKAGAETGRKPGPEPGGCPAPGPEGEARCGSEQRGRRYAACWIALRRQGLGPTGRVKVQNSSNFTGSARLPSTTWPLSSVV